MTREHPITPPLELKEKWRDEALNSFPDDENQCPCDIDDARDEYIATQAANWGADQELEACCEWLINKGHEYEHVALRDARRPKPPSLKEQALETLHSMRIAPVVINGINVNADVMNKYEIIRRAIESLPD